MDVNTYLAKLNYQPIDTLPWVEKNFACEDEEPNIRRYMPHGVVLKRANRGTRHTIGHNIGGSSTTGCDCCSKEWIDAVHDYSHWAWIWDVKE